MNKTIIIFCLLLSIFLISFYIYRNNQNINKDIVKESQEDFLLISDKPYMEVKKKLINKGWEIYLSPDFKSVNDKDFPEIGDCGEGIDAICNVAFKKKNIINNINVQKDGRNGYKEWIVVGKV